MERKRIIIILVAALILAFFSAGACAGAEEGNLIQNAGFEEEVAGTASYWAYYDWENKPGVTEFSTDADEKHSGSRSGRIISHSPNDARFKQVVRARPESYYKLSCWIKTENVGTGGKGANLSVEGILDTTREIKGTSETWEFVELYGKTGKKQESFTVTIGLGGYGSLNSGKAWFDDVVVEELDSAPQGQNVINLYPPVENLSGSSGKTGPIFWVVLFIVLAAFLGALAYIYLKGRRTASGGTDRNTQTISGNIVQTRVLQLALDRKDFLIMASMTAVYLAVALINLGSLRTPKTTWQPVKPGEYCVLDMGRQISIEKIGYYGGLGAGSFRVEYMKETGEYAPLGIIKLNNYDDFYKWRYLNAAATTRMLKVIVEQPGGTMNEITVFETGNTAPVENAGIVEKSEEPGGKGSVENLFDEPQAAPYRSTFLNSTYFDEIYHARTAYEHLNGIEPYESTHPPLGKLFIALGIWIFGMNPFGWRIVGTLFGAAMIPAMYIFGKKLFEKRFYAFCAAFLMMTDFMHFAQTRIATIDVYVTFFIILMYYFMLDYYVNKSYVLGFGKSLKVLFLSGLFFGIGAACKWIALYGAAGLALAFLLVKIDENRDYMKLKEMKKGRKTPWLKDFIPLYVNGTVLYCILFFIIIPGVIYLLSYIPFMMIPTPGHGLQHVFSYQVNMYNYHKNLTATHDFSSSWWQWPIMTKPVWFYSGAGASPGKVSTIASFGNPAVWWVSIVAVIASAVAAIKKRDRKMTVVLIAIAAQYLPWVLVPRIAFIYHYFSIIPFAILSIVYLIRNVLEKYPEAKTFVYAYLVTAAILFAVFYPVLSGMEADRSYVDSLKWLKSWVF